MDMIREFIDLSKEHEKILVGALWKNPAIYEDISNNKLVRESFTDRALWSLYFIGKKLYAKGIDTFDPITVEMYLEKVEAPRKAFKSAGGYDFVNTLTSNIDSDIAYEYHLEEVLKYASLRKMYKQGFINENKEDLIEKLCKSTLQQAEHLISYRFDEAFENVDFGEYEVVDITKGELENAFKDVKRGVDMGLPIYNAPILTKQIKGFARGRLLYLALKSGEGKSTILRNLFLQTIIDNDEKVLILINEERKRDWLINLTIAIANTRFNKKNEIIKDDIFSGNIDKREEAAMNNAIKWYDENYNGKIKLAVLKSYRFKDVSKILKKHSKLGFNYVLFDTFKPDTGVKTDLSRWERFSEMSQELYDLVKPENLNMGVIATVQLKISGKERYLTHDSIGKAKEIVEVADITLLGRLFFENEYPSGEDLGGDTSREIRVYRRRYNKKKEKHETVRVDDISRDKQYIIVYFGKNRAGGVQQQIVYEMDFDKNKVIEIGFCNMKPEY